MDIYLFFVVVLFALAISDLIVGVSNDAVNFLNSAIGSKVASRKVIMIIASLGILAGALFSNGMMEVARKGIFHPQNYYFTEIMVVFMAVMITDILLLDFFNTVGLPTSTTVSIVFELLGAAVAVAVYKIATQPEALELSEYINSSKALAIISGILLSVVVAFTVGMLVQWISRVLFTFNYNRPMKFFGAIWGGIAIASITYFILIKGAKSATFMTDDMKIYIKDNALQILAMSFVAWAVILQLLNWMFKINILKVIVLVGTFALAMAFAGNDLVNFIGVPLAGFESFKQFQLNGGNDILMEGLANNVQTPSYFLVIAGGIMVVTLWFSKKARSVTETELNLSRQDEGYERFGSSFIARMLVRRSVASNTFFSKIIPERVSNSIRKRFDQTEYKKRINKEENPPMFDLVRASVNLTVASILISFATSLKLPLSTTYVTFMVAMGTSLADGAWGRDSAVYRITGVFAVIGGWFMTAMIAFTVAFILAMFIVWAKIVAVLVLLAIAIYALIKTHKTHKKKEAEKVMDKVEEAEDTVEKVLKKCNKVSSSIISDVSDILNSAVNGLITEDLKMLKQQKKNVADLNDKTKKNKDNIYKMLEKLNKASLETGHFYVQVLDYQREIAHCTSFIIEPILKHVDNQHKAIAEVQKEELSNLVIKINDFSAALDTIIKEEKYDALDSAIKMQSDILDGIKTYRKAQIKRIKNKEVGTRNSMLYMNLMGELKNLMLFTINMVKAQRDFNLMTKEEY
ncbi:MAG: inorganic phosphate transporter [Salinivirgaceae bacterium]|nr:inorganic phosphate transporter [Salinivirgaceae bacterium]